MEKEANGVLAKQNIQLRNELENLKNQIKNVTKPGLKWVSSMSCRGIPSDAVVCGRNAKGETFCVGRVYHIGDILPAKVACHSNSTEQRKAYINYDGSEHIKYDFEILCGNNFKWVKDKNGAVPVNSIVAGETVDGEKLYIGRTIEYYPYVYPFTLGRIHPSLGRLYVSSGDGKEYSIEVYEVLTELPSPKDVC